MRFTGLICLVLLPLLAACAPVEYGDLADPGIDVSAGTGEVRASYNDNGITAVFPALEGARSYGYSFSGEKPIAGSVVFDDGYYRMSLPKPDYTADEYSFELYASESRNPSEEADPGWVRFASVTASYAPVDIDAVVPEGYVSARLEDSVTIAFINQPGDMEYKAVLPDGKEIESGEDTITITGLSASSHYDIEIYQRYSGTEIYGRNPGVVSVEAYDPEEVLCIAVDGKAITVSALPSASGRLSIVNDGTGAVLVSAETSGSSHTFRESDITLFDTGIFHAVFEYDGKSVSSGNIPYTAELNVSSYDVMRQHFAAAIPAPEGIDTGVFSAVITGVPSAQCDAVWVDGNAIVTISGLSSLTSYEGSINAGTESYPLSFTTEGFEGSYRFLNESVTDESKYMREYAVDVKIAESGSASRYWFYASSDDPHSEELGYSPRISPLIDPSLEDVPEGAIDYNGNAYYQQAYRWNNTKWNSSNATLNTWRVMKYTASGDSYESIASSNASMFNLTVDAETTSRFILEEDKEGNATLIFFNKITGGAFNSIANNMIRKNPDPNTARFEDDAPFTFELKLEESV